jgi:cellobiose phosphorylase
MRYRCKRRSGDAVQRRAAAQRAASCLPTQLGALFALPWRHEEFDQRGERLSFFCGEDRHVVLGAKERRVLRPHGHLLRTGRHLTPDESALTSTVWMSGVFHSLLTQGHVSINRFLSTVRSYLGLFRSHGLRVFVELEGGWRLLNVPSAFEMSPDACRWIYGIDARLIEVRCEAQQRSAATDAVDHALPWRTAPIPDLAPRGAQ